MRGVENIWNHCCAEQECGYEKSTLMNCGDTEGHLSSIWVPEEENVLKLKQQQLAQLGNFLQPLSSDWELD